MCHNAGSKRSDLPVEGGGQFELLYEALEDDGSTRVRRYTYRWGKALVFGAGFRHGTEPGSSRRPRAFLCFVFGTDKPEYWPAIVDTLNYQSRCLWRPDGKMVLSALGRGE